MDNLWANRSFPKNGWLCDYVEDIEEPSHLCDACCVQYVRYIHYLTHKYWDTQIAVGCVCAGKLTGNPEEAKRKENLVKNRGVRKEKWLTRKWKISQNGNQYLKGSFNGAGYHVVVFKSKHITWNFNVTVGGFKYKSKVWFNSKTEAKIAAFMVIERVTS